MVTRKKKTKYLKSKKNKIMNDFYIFSETKIYKEQNGKVLENSNIIKKIKNNKMLIKGYKNGKKINITKKLKIKSNS